MAEDFVVGGHSQPGVNKAIQTTMDTYKTSDTGGLVVDEDDAEETTEKIPEPIVVRAFLVALVGLTGALLGKEFDVTWIDSAVTIYAIAAPIALGFWARRHVTPLPKK